LKIDVEETNVSCSLALRSVGPTNQFAKNSLLTYPFARCVAHF